MPKRLGSDEVIRILREYGFFFVTQRGSHAKYKNSAGRIARQHGRVVRQLGRRSDPSG